ncbi:flagellar hook-length control protein FliK [Mesorhizobium sp.]|uniref:flagellar hook-length control protein FliK n=2 Tax=unclassified Mesorhizobium TaxID=325217 RepID=UPI000FE94D7C|nr:flagellar hook-length control protein FliK [Mesorhizobium sp.]RWO87803.1 MAG: flagellar hook-length control protein FliK [Mesorhizobium sp.]RWP11978.1 MAG: flagellar hook-length control protein FliK [Mesorhizobium sp.]
MTTSLGSALPGFASTRATSEQPAANGRNDDAGFGKMLRDDAGAARPERQPSTEAGSRDQRWSKLAAGLAGHDAKAEPASAEPARTISAKVANVKTGKDDLEANAKADAEETAPDAEPLQDDLPLLIAFHDLRHFSTTAKAAGGNTTTGENPSDPALDGQASLPKTYRPKSAGGREALETMSKPEQASIVDGPLTALDGQSPSAASSATKRDAAAAAQKLPDAPAADVPGVRSKHAANAMKSIEDVQSSMRPEAGKQSLSTARIDVVSERSFPAPPQSPISQAALNVINAIAADAGPQKALSASPTSAHLASSVAVPTHVLKIELHPAELGMVTANLRLSGEQLSIELKPETHDAYRRLSADSEAIVKSLRGLGFEVDKVTILQPSVAVPATTRADATAPMAAATGRDPASFQPGNSGSGNGGAGGQQPGQQSSGKRNDDAQDYGRGTSPARERAGGDIFI